jgi:ribulose 1,5-bisphosphate synthetase/thiazole synthase
MMTKTKEFDEADILVCGAGPAGFAAAVAAGRSGLRTILLESNGFPGGMMTAGWVNPIYGFYARHIQVVRGIGQELIEELKGLPGGTLGHQYRHDCIVQRKKIGECQTGKDEKICPVSGVSNICAVDSELAKIAMIRLLRAAGVICYYHVNVVDVEMDVNRIRGVHIQGKSGKELIRSKVVIDTTGDADVAALAGNQYEKGFGEKGLMKPPTLKFKISGVKASHDRIRIELPETKPGEETFAWLMALPEEGEYTVNAPSGLIGFDSTDTKLLSSGQEIATEAMYILFRWLKENDPHCAEIKLKGLAPQIGIRDSRRIDGRYTLTEDDILSARKFPDQGIANGVHPIDLHIKDKHFNDQHLMVMPCGDYYQIPFDCLLPRDIQNLIVAGRPISASFLAQGSLRVMATCMAMGQAAGTAAAMAVSKNQLPENLVRTEIRDQLIRQGAYLGYESNLPLWNTGMAPLPDHIRENAYPND